MKPLAPSTALRGAAVLAAVAAVLCFLLLPPIPQWDSYHAFADQRTLLGVPNALDVLSNGGFLIAGVAGLLALWGPRRRRAAAPSVGAAAVAIEPWERDAFTLLFAAVALVAVGSAYYHLAPDTPRLFWDRLPLSVVLGAIFGLVLADRTTARAGRRLFLPLVAAGAVSTIWWKVSGDLRPYGLVQGLTMLELPLLLLLRPGRHDRAGYLVAMGALYGAAKLGEALDHQIFALTGGVVSGHTLKHLFASVAVALLVPYVLRRRLVVVVSGP